LFENTAASVHGSPLFQPNVIVAIPSVILDNGIVGSQTIYTNNTSAKVRVAAPLEWGSWSDELLSNPSFEMGNLTGWTAMGPAAASVEVFNATSGGDIYTQRSLRVGNYGVCTKDTPGTNDDSGVWQNVSLTAYANAIDAGNAVMNASARLYPSEWTWDDCALIVRFYSSSGGFISAWNTTGEYGSGTVYNPKAWMLGSGYAHFTQGQLKQFGCYNYTIPTGTRTVGIQLGMGEHKDPAYCGGQADEASIKIRAISSPLYYPSDYSMPTGAYVSGATPSSIQTVDSDYFIVRSLPATSTTAYNPSGYSTLGSTTLVSGATSDLVSNNNAYMTYRSYVSSSSMTSNTSAFVAYRDSTTSLNTPKDRVWDGAAWGSQSEMSTSGSPVRYARTACCPIEQRSCEKMVATLSDDGYLDAYVWDGTAWNVTNDIGRCWSTAPSDARRPYDVAYMSNGQALLLYGTTVSGGTNDLAYRVWTFGSGWGPEQYYNDANHASKITVTYVDVASGLNNQMGAMYIDSTNSDANAMIWNGSSWVNQIELTGTVAITTEECIGIASESLTGNIVAVVGEGQFVKWAKYSSGSWSSVDKFDINSGNTGAMNWLKLASSESNRIMLTSVDGSTDLCTALLDDNTIGSRQFGTASESIGSMSANTAITGLRFTAQASKSVSSFLIYLQTVTTPPTYKFGIETVDATYMYSGTYVGGANNYVNATPAAAGWLNITLPSVATLSAGTVYCITVRYATGTIGASNLIAVRRIGAVPSSWRASENTIDPWLNTISTGAIQARDPIFILQYNDGTSESMPFESATNFDVYGNNWASEKWNQTRTVTVYGVNIPFLKGGTPPNNLEIVLRNETGSTDLVTLSVEASEITTTFIWYEKLLSSPITLESGKQYRLTVRQGSGGGSATDYYRIYRHATTQSGDFTYRGNESVYSTSSNGGSSWTDQNTMELIHTISIGQTDMNSWLVHQPWDAAVDTHASRCADFAWEYRSASATANYRNQGLLVYGTTSGAITWQRFRAPNYMTAVTSPSITGTHPWIQLVSNQRTVSGDALILGAVLDSSFQLGAVRWDGTTFTIIGNNAISSNTVVSTYECFKIEFQHFGPPAEFTSEVELTGTSNTESWTQLAWSVDSALTTDSVTVTIQVYNYTGASGYPASGDGYDTYTSNPIANTDETRNQTITTNSTCFRDGSGNWRTKIKAIKPTATQFDFKVDWIEFKTHYTDCTVSTEFLLSSMTTNTPSQLSFTVVSQYDIASVNIIIQAWNYSSSTYDTSGEGYMNYISSGSNETKLLSISANPQFYASNGNAKIRITGTKTTITQYQQETNQVKLTYSYSSSSAYDYVLRVVNQVSDAWNITVKSYNSSNLSRLSSTMISFHDGTSSSQIIINNGNITQSEGSPYVLAGNATIYISMSTLQATNAGTSYLHVYLKILTPNTTTYLLYVITFEIT
jgi:hypothetical protein